MIYANSGVTISQKIDICKDVVVSSTDGGALVIADGVSLGRSVRIDCSGGSLDIGENVHIGTGSVLVSHCEIRIGEGTQIAEYVVIRDQDHRAASRPIRNSGFDLDPIIIGKGCWLGAKVTVLRGSSIGDGAIIGAHSLVRGRIPPYTLAVGCPARVVKILQGSP